MAPVGGGSEAVSRTDCRGYVYSPISSLGEIIFIISSCSYLARLGFASSMPSTGASITFQKLNIQYFGHVY